MRSRHANIKHKISTHTLQNQGCRCAYCERILERGGVQIEHIAPKDSNENFCYEPYNLVSSCGICNAIANKGAKDTILPPKNNNYVNNNFKIVHPYFDGNGRIARLVHLWFLIQKGYQEAYYVLTNNLDLLEIKNKG